ncbi:MAG: 4-hydroxy-tetrahydrodipicolinate synthase [Gemmatimonadetes bacterium]|nr:4-hydroxy-tetrahydrodipicolinate synthase [Gemmatimonadota bacterium]
MTRLQGCGTALVTPMRLNGAVDFPALRALVEWQISEGIHFLVPCGSTGEAATMSPEERAEVVSAVVEVAHGRVKVVGGATSNDTRAAVAEAKRIAAAGADYILSATPYYNKPTPEGLYQHFGAIADAAGRPVILYNVPGRTSVNLDAATTLRLAERAGIAGVKEASGNLGQIMDIIRARPESFSVLSGDDAFALAVMACGGDGLISVVSNEVPAPMARLIDSALKGTFDVARSIHYRLLPLMNLNFIESNPIPVKAALHAMGRIEYGIRLPLVPLSEAKRPALLDTLREAGVASPLSPLP